MPAPFLFRSGYWTGIFSIQMCMSITLVRDSGFDNPIEYDSIEDNGLSVHRTVEAMKFAYAQRLKLGDPAFNDTVNKVYTHCILSMGVLHPYSLYMIIFVSSKKYNN